MANLCTGLGLAVKLRAMLLPRDLPRYENLRQQAQRYPQIDPRSVEAFLVLLRTATDTLYACDTYLARHRISQGKFTVMMILNRNPDQGFSPSELADKCGVTRATITGLLDGLEREQFVRREGDASDRRRALVYLTATARTFLDAFLPDFFSQIGQLMGELQEGEKLGLTALLQKVAVRLPEFMGGVAANAPSAVTPDY
jgi:DNA-binding MarR family transcriptional regulator